MSDEPQQTIANLGPLPFAHERLSITFTVPYESIEVAPGRFQVRNPRALSFSKAEMVKLEEQDFVWELSQKVSQGEQLAPIVLWRDPSTEKLFVIDGFHRMEAYADAGVPPDYPIPAQELLRATEEEARSVAMELNQMNKLKWHAKESQDVFWRALLCGEVRGSYREIEKRYGIPRSTANRMTKKKPAILSLLRKDATLAGVPFSDEYIRRNAPPWGEVFTWEQKHKDAQEQTVTETNAAERHQATKEKLKRALVKQFGKRLLRQRQAGQEAMQEVFNELFGETLEQSEADF